MVDVTADVVRQRDPWKGRCMRVREWEEVLQTERAECELAGRHGRLCHTVKTACDSDCDTAPVQRHGAK